MSERALEAVKSESAPPRGRRVACCTWLINRIPQEGPGNEKGGDVERAPRLLNPLAFCASAGLGGLSGEPPGKSGSRAQISPNCVFAHDGRGRRAER
jgi:hypothetical protein